MKPVTVVEVYTTKFPHKKGIAMNPENQNYLGFILFLCFSI